MGFGLAIQDAIHGKLSADANVTDLVSGVLDNVNQNQASPYITIGEDVLTGWDTNTTIGADASITIHIWSRHKGRKELKEISGAVYNSLQRQDLFVSGYDFISLDFETENSFLDSDGLTRHGVQTYRVLIDQN